MSLVALSSLLLAFVAPPAARPVVRSPPRMALKGNDGVDFPEMDGSNMRIGIIKARWHEADTDNLVSGIKASLTKCGVLEENIIESEVPGSFELPLASRYLALSGTVDAIIPVGVLIKGETTHFEVISETVTSSLMSVGLQTGVPVLMGVLTAMNDEQVKARSTGSNNHGIQWGMAAVEMGLLRQSAVGGKKKFFMGFGDDPSEEENKESKLGAGGKKIGF